MAEEPEEVEIGTGEETAAEIVISKYLGTIAHFSIRACRASVNRGNHRRF